jgi:hypothetical protein
MLRLVLEYDGTDFAVAAPGAGERTVQGVLGEALARVCGAGRVEARAPTPGARARAGRACVETACARQAAAGAERRAAADLAVLSAEGARGLAPRPPPAASSTAT